MCRRDYGSLDVFLRTLDGGLFVRDEEATDWKRAGRARTILGNIRREGVPLSTLSPRAEGGESQAVGGGTGRAGEKKAEPEK